MKDEFNNEHELDHDDFEKYSDYDENYVEAEQAYEEELNRRQDSFLEAYHVYLTKKTALAKNIVKRKIIEVELIDPSFDFHIEL